MIWKLLWPLRAAKRFIFHKNSVFELGKSLYSTEVISITVKHQYQPKFIFSFSKSIFNGWCLIGLVENNILIFYKLKLEKNILWAHYIFKVDSFRLPTRGLWVGESESHMPILLQIQLFFYFLTRSLNFTIPQVAAYM